MYSQWLRTVGLNLTLGLNRRRQGRSCWLRSSRRNIRRRLRLFWMEMPHRSASTSVPLCIIQWSIWVNCLISKQTRRVVYLIQIRNKSSPKRRWLIMRRRLELYRRDLILLSSGRSSSAFYLEATSISTRNKHSWCPQHTTTWRVHKYKRTMQIWLWTTTYTSGVALVPAVLLSKMPS